ncbi:hypothetical protein AB0M36_29550 [Actinoplanes sp. NPDC051346]|uniref:hypothetical protein n=1 Tax=Actinoplanes sp. NPDC051346 TaxID=3155048 RepID=UPI003447ECC7
MSDATPEAEPGTEELPEPFANRAARRAKGKKTANPPVTAAGGRPVRSGTVQSPRQYGNRRSG